MEFTREQFEEQSPPRFGTANPERMRIPFWDWMIRGDGKADDRWDLGERPGYEPSQARELLGFPLSAEGKDAAIWTLYRSGETRNVLPDGKVVRVGGYYFDEDDPGSHHYNDVIVFHPDGAIEIYGYPRDVFPPIDFHTATRVGNQLIIIGSHVYTERPWPWSPPVFALDLTSYQIREIPACGESPGQISDYVATRNDEGLIVVEGGEVTVATEVGDLTRRNLEEYAFDSSSGRWIRLTRRNWRQLSVIPTGPWADWRLLRCRDLYPSTVEHVTKSCPDWTEVRFFVEGFPIHVAKPGWKSAKRHYGSVDITFEGDAPADLVARVAGEIRANVERAIGTPCTIA